MFGRSESVSAQAPFAGVGTPSIKATSADETGTQTGSFCSTCGFGPRTSTRYPMCCWLGIRRENFTVWTRLLSSTVWMRLLDGSSDPRENESPSGNSASSIPGCRSGYQTLYSRGMMWGYPPPRDSRFIRLAHARV